MSLAHLPALVHRVDVGRLELLERVAGLVARAQRQLALGTAIDRREAFSLGRGHSYELIFPSPLECEFG